MIKFLLIILIVFLTAVIGLGVVFKRFLNVLGVKSSKSKSTSKYDNQNYQKNNADVLYKQNNVVVLKGEAGQKNKENK